MIDFSVQKTGLEHNIQKARENHIIIPTIAQMQHPEKRRPLGHQPPEPFPHHLEE